MEQLLCKIFASDKIKVTGSFARQNETVNELEFVIPFPTNIISEKIESIPEFIFLKIQMNILYKYNDGINIKTICDRRNQLSRQNIFETTNSAEFNKVFFEKFSGKEIQKAKSDEEIFKAAGLQYIPACLRESGNVLELAQRKKDTRN